MATDTCEARTILPRRASAVTVAGLVLGISINDVTPPATAARLSVAISAFSVSPGSRKCTWVSMTPGMM